MATTRVFDSFTLTEMGWPPLKNMILFENGPKGNLELIWVQVRPTGFKETVAHQSEKYVPENFSVPSCPAWQAGFPV